MDEGRIPADVEDSLFSTVQLALHCFRWGKRVPATDGDSAWEQCFVGPLVTHAFTELFKVAQDTSSVRVAWKGWVRPWPPLPPVYKLRRSRITRCVACLGSGVEVSPGGLAAMPLWDSTRPHKPGEPAVSMRVKPGGAVASGAASDAQRLWRDLPSVVALIKETQTKQCGDEPEGL